MYVPSNEQVETVAQHFYELYCDHSQWKNYQGLPCPMWSYGATKGDPVKQLTEAVRGHWRCVARDALANGFRLPEPGARSSAITYSGDSA